MCLMSNPYGEHGQDMFVETDCSSTGDCEGTGSGTEPHLMIYAETECGTTDPWFDVGLSECRADNQ